MTNGHALTVAHAHKFRVCGERVEASSTILLAHPLFAQPRLLLTGHPRGRGPATQQILIDCGSSRQGKRSCQALETNFSSGAQKPCFPGSCLPNFRLPFCKNGADCHVAAHTDPQLMHRFGCESPSSTSVHGHSPELEQLDITFAQALTSMRTLRL